MTSFRKRNVQKSIPDTRISPQTGQLIASSGNLWLDKILGGGLTVGSICLIEEDHYNLYGKILAKYFLAEGEQSNHANWLATLDTDCKSILSKLPECVENIDELKEEENEIDSENHRQADSNRKLENGQYTSKKYVNNDLRIAWRYTDLPLLNAKERNVTIGHHFNLMKQIDYNKIDCQTWPTDNDNNGDVITLENTNEDYSNSPAQLISNIVTTTKTDTKSKEDIVMNKMTSIHNNNDNIKNNLNESDSTKSKDGHNDLIKLNSNICSNQLGFSNSAYESCLKAIISFQNRKPNETQLSKRLARFCLMSLGSPLWYGQQFDKDLLKFLTILRAVMRTAPAVCLITMPIHLIMKYNDQTPEKIRNLVDYAIELKSFYNTTTMLNDDDLNPVCKGYNGLVKLHKISALNTLSVYRPETFDLAFKLQRKRFVIEKFHLPPELQSDADNLEPCSSLSSLLPSTNCGVDVAVSSNSLDF